MRWTDFYVDYTEWSESTIRTRISSLDDIGSSDEIIEVVQDFSSEKLKDQLIRKAIRMNVKFSQDDFIELENELSDTVFHELAVYAGFDADNPYFNEDNLIWDDFYSCYTEWSSPDVLRRISKLKNIGNPDEVCEVICCMPDSECEDALYKKALSLGTKFNNRHLEDMCRLEIDDKDISEEEERQIEDNVDAMLEDLGIIHPFEEFKPRKSGFFGTMFAVLAALGGAGKRKRNSNYCDGNCNSCPRHYGYRYGRWYYGRGHRYGCQHGGKGNDPKRTARD